MANPPKRGRITSNLGLHRAGDPEMDIASIRQLARSYPNEFMNRMQDLVSQGKLGLSSGKNPDGSWRQGISDMKGLFRALHDVQVKTNVDLGGGARAFTDTSAFPLLMGSLVVDEINRAYDEVPTIGQDLVRDMESNKKFAHVVKIVNNVGQELNTKEGDEFPMIGASEQFAVIGHNRKGFQLALSMETLEENDVGNFLQLVDQGGQFAAELIEEQTLSRICDQNGSASSPAEPYAFRPNGTATQLYNSTANTPGAQAPSGTRILNNPLSSSANLDAAYLVVAAMQNTRGRRIAIPMSECQLLVPAALLFTASKITRSEMEPGVFNEINNWGPQGRFRPNLVSSPKMDDISTTAWYLGAFQQQFVRKWKIRLETVSVYSDPLAFARTREAYRTRVAWDVEVGARDYVFCVQSLSGTAAATAPALATTNP